MIYFPFWMIRLSAGKISRILILDAVANSLTRTLSLAEWTHMLQQSKKAPAPISFGEVSFIPFKCPNCGWDLPLHRFNIIHLCNTCHRAWIEREGRFRGIAFDVVKPPDDQQPCVYLPFWTFPAKIAAHNDLIDTAGKMIDFSGQFPTRAPQKKDENPLHFYLPAVEIRNIATANKLATDVTQKQPTLDFMPKEHLSDCTLLGAFLPPRAARKMSDILLLSLTPKTNRNRHDFVRDAAITAGKMKLIWWPFFEQRLFLRDAVCGCGIQKGTVAPSQPLLGAA
jgi:hypothetical protein